MDLFKEDLDPKHIFDTLILDENYAEAFAYAIDNHIEREALKICIEYIQEDDEREDDTPVDYDSLYWDVPKKKNKADDEAVDMMKLYWGFLDY
ncbi:hypothetical protein A3K80_09215 [Candidatus Bathyarchaeota archaeon RBG_13_38_9]|nr:MAG: hypothetical protein A3K80_09215 [Candidatus Bathyarchaeota archaeon RBG_13_38_9]